MFGLGMPEILLILAIALIVIGPKKLPDLAKTLGRAMGEFKRSAQDFKRSIDIDSSIKDIADIDPPESKLKQAVKTANQDASTPPFEREDSTFEKPDTQTDISSSTAEETPEMNSKNDSIKHE